MDVFNSYKLWLALKQHFTNDDYNYFLMNGQVKCSIQSFNQRKDKYNFHKLVRKYTDLEGFYIANFIYGDPQYSGDLMTVEADLYYKRWLKNQNALGHVFKNEYSQIYNNFQEKMLQCIDGQNPPLLIATYQGYISIETLLILNEIGPGFIDNWNNQITDPIIWPKFYKKMIKYRPWITKLDLTKFKAIVEEVENAEKDHTI